MLAEQELLIKLSGAAFMAVLNFITNECWVFSLFALSELPSHGVCFSLTCEKPWISPLGFLAGHRLPRVNVT